MHFQKGKSQIFVLKNNNSIRDAYQTVVELAPFLSGIDQAISTRHHHLGDFYGASQDAIATERYSASVEETAIDA